NLDIFIDIVPFIGHSQAWTRTKNKPGHFGLSSPKPRDPFLRAWWWNARVWLQEWPLRPC
ncbi:unnamed protein product, partial [Staurois parvus]